MKFIELFGDSFKEDTDEIIRAIDENSDIVFVYSGPGTLYDYIDKLYDKGRGLNAEYLYQFKVCYEKKDLNVSYSVQNGSKSSKNISCMSGLINVLDGKSNCRIVVETNDRVQLAFIVQQLIFIEYPLEMVDILLRKEERDADKTRRFMNEGGRLLEGCQKAIQALVEMRYQAECESDNDNPTKADRLRDIDDALNSCYEIKAQILASLDVELKFAVAASKKAGKSVIVNCFLGEQIAPTSTELATPNNCLYKKSPDGMYHLQLEGEPDQVFDSRDKIYDVINGHFRKAQNNREAGFALPDMHIEYVTDENNFSSYTIFDTAGPDAAGTRHPEVAESAMQKCDVAVFAIDYSKYLTTSEEVYLRRVKEIFTNQNKFHSLIFALNKIDVRYTDVESAKSFVMSVDFLKTRLADIDEAYRDCIIFPTCSLEYFSAIEAEKAGVTELNAENELPIGDMKRVKFSHKDVPALAWLHTHSENLEYYHGIKNISYDVFKKDSGMPALMRYVSYVAQSKARDEIVNNVTFKIAAQRAKIQSVLDFIANIEALINADDKKISEITQIIKDYSDAVQKILSPNFSPDELGVLDDKSILKPVEGDYGKFMSERAEALKPAFEKKRVADQMYDVAVEIMWSKIDGRSNIDGNEIDQLFTAEDFKVLANRIAKQRIEEAAGETYQLAAKAGDEVKAMVAYRQKKLREESDICRERLAKEDISIELPELPEFEFDVEMPPPGEIVVEVGSIDFDLYKKLSGLFEKRFWSNFGVFFRSLFGSANAKDYKRKISVTQEGFFRACDRNLKANFKNAVYENDIAEKLEKMLTKSVVEQYMGGLINELMQGVANMNKAYSFCIERFRLAVDDREKYKADIALHNLRKANILAIEEHTADFMQVWNTIICDFADGEEMGSEKDSAAEAE